MIIHGSVCWEFISHRRSSETCIVMLSGSSQWRHILHLPRDMTTSRDLRPAVEVDLIQRAIVCIIDSVDRSSINPFFCQMYVLHTITGSTLHTNLLARPSSITSDFTSWASYYFRTINLEVTACTHPLSWQIINLQTFNWSLTSSSPLLPSSHPAPALQIYDFGAI